MLKIKNLCVNVNAQRIIENLNLQIEKAEVHVLMGPNGAGKSSLAFSLAGHPDYQIKKGQVTLNGKEITHLPVEKRAQAGLFLGFQLPVEIEGLSVITFLKHIINATRTANHQKPLTAPEFFEVLEEKKKLLNLKDNLLKRHLNVGFSGGEKKKIEILQMLLLSPRLAVLDEVDSGVDLDALKTIAKGVQLAQKQGTSFLIITHNPRLLDYVTVDQVHVFISGKIVETGQMDLVKKLEKKGYDGYQK